MDDIRRQIHRVPRDLDLVVGIPRSGMIPAYAVGLQLNLAVIDLPAFLEGKQPKHGATRPLARPAPDIGAAKRILLIDDSYSSGGSMRAALDALRGAGYGGGIVTCSAIVDSATRPDLDVHFIEMELPRIFEWNMFHHEVIEDACLDFDGVLCLDPTEADNDDGPAYEAFLERVAPRYLPSRRVGSIVSARLERYRERTEAWLARHGVEYGVLHLLDLPSQAERIRTRAHTRHKIDYYAKAASPLFIESDEMQAIEIAQHTGKPVLCTDTMRVYTGDGFYPRNVHKVTAMQVDRLTRNIKACLKRALPETVVQKLRAVRRA